MSNVAQYEEVYQKIIDKMIQLYTSTDSQLVEDKDNVDSDDDIWQPLTKVRTTEHSSHPRVLAALETDRYLTEHNIKVKSDPFTWWKERELIYPKLFKLAMQYLSVPASSVPCERVFSKAGNIMTQKRNRLSSMKLKEIIFIQHNYR